MRSESIVEKIVRVFKENEWTLGTAESCTGGNIAHNVTLVPGCSEMFNGGIVSYANEVKISLLGVSVADLEKEGAVSQSVVEQMAKGAVEALQATFAVATSGIAGPGGGSEGKPVGTVWLAASDGVEVLSRVCHFGRVRHENIEKATEEAFFLLKEFVETQKSITFASDKCGSQDAQAKALSIK